MQTNIHAIAMKSSLRDNANAEQSFVEGERVLKRHWISAVLSSLALLQVHAQAQDVPPRAEIMQEEAHAISDSLRDINANDHRPNPLTAAIPVRKAGSNSANASSGAATWASDPDLQPIGTYASTLPGGTVKNFGGLSAIVRTSVEEVR